ncbi:cell division protein FtsX [Yoonia sp. R2331]|uniref:cell division protein FtsX n=1 Tax=Yoonia sp. R2331 TaxID=3237238 RepID=UPI0034E49EC6
MKLHPRRVLDIVMGDPKADRAVPPSGFTARLTLFTAAAMAFLAVFALALSMATGRLADRWSEELARTSTLRISAPADQAAAQVRAAIALLETTPGVAAARALTAEEQRNLLEPWFGPDLPIEALPIPQLVEIIEEGRGYDATGLRARLQAEVPGAVLDDHTRWREPLVAAAGRLRSLGWFAILLIGAATAAMITLAAQSALAANAQVIRVMRLVGAEDSYIARAFVRRFTSRAFLGALAGTIVGMVAVAILPDADDVGGFLTDVGFRGFGWFWPLCLPPLAAIVAFFATRAAALRTLKEQS